MILSDLHRRQLPIKVDEEIPVSVLGFEEREEMLWISLDEIEKSAFPPCIKNILKAIERAEGEKGLHRKGAILASFLGQCGWNAERAKPLWMSTVATEERIYDEWFRKMHCPKCETIKRQSGGYPDLGLADMDVCQPDEKCKQFKSPVEYAADLISKDDLVRGRKELIRTVFLARLFDWNSGREFYIELSPEEKEELESLIKTQAENANATIILKREKFRGRLRPKFALKEMDLPRRRMLSDIL